RFLAADKGTIFLDEIGDIPLSMQVKLLRVIQERELQRVGGDQTVRVDVRILAATNKDLACEVEGGRFRQDLYYRLNVVALQLPPLRERGEDIPLLAMHFMKLFAERNGKTVKGFTPGAMDRLLKHNWPGNVRELENAVERAVVLLVGEYISERELPPTIGGQEAEAPVASRLDFANMTLEEIERLAVMDTLAQVGGNKSEAARRLGINRKTLLSKLGDGK
ncbi:MAG: sigma 54-interacting transcriptional regulator, partial [Desulfovibrio desulfuricans]|nr:sigma 54-interacting transcriptional regulator [Desulfovibrio desulfuricans]